MFDEFGRELFIAKEQWRASPPPGMLKSDWNNPDQHLRDDCDFFPVPDSLEFASLTAPGGSHHSAKPVERFELHSTFMGLPRRLQPSIIPALFAETVGFL